MTPVHWRCRWKINTCCGVDGDECHTPIAYVWSVRKYGFFASSQEHQHYHHPLMKAAFQKSFLRKRAGEQAKTDKQTKHLVLLAKHQEQRAARVRREAMEDVVVQEAEAKGIGYMHLYFSFHEMALRPMPGKDEELKALLSRHGIVGVVR